MKKPAIATLNTALAGVHVRVLRDAIWSNSQTLDLVRANGGKVSFTDSASITHLVTIDEPIAPYSPNNGTLTAEGFCDYVVARTNADKFGAKTCSLQAFRVSVAAMIKSTTTAQTERTVRSLSSALIPGFVGL